MRSRHLTLIVTVLCAAGAGARAQDAPVPGQDQAPIHLHMPAQSLPSAPSPAPEETKAGVIHLHVLRPRHVPAKQAGMRPEPRATIPLSLDDSQEPPISGPAPPAPAAPTQTPPHVIPAPAPAITQQARTETRGNGDHANLTKRGAILFEKDAPSPSPAQYRGLQMLAADLNAALEVGTARIQIEAYGGAPGDKSSDARRLSLRRALAVRQLLIDNGIPSSRIDVRAMGGVDDKGPADRVDVFVRTG